MSLYNSLYNELELPKYYRVEGYKSYPYFSTNQDKNFIPANGYIYFSGQENHHLYYTNRKLLKYIDTEIMKELGYKFNKKTLHSSIAMNEIETKIKNMQIEPIISISFGTSKIFDLLLENNSKNSKKKTSIDSGKIERVDTTKHQGGYGFSGEWLKLFQSLTYLYSYQRITNENLLEFLYAMRRLYSIHKIDINNPSAFLQIPQNKTISLNNQAFSDFNKYEILNALQNIVENNLYYEESILSKNPDRIIRELIGMYEEEKKEIKDKLDKEYKVYTKK